MKENKEVKIFVDNKILIIYLKSIREFFSNDEWSTCYTLICREEHRKKILPKQFQSPDPLTEIKTIISWHKKGPITNHKNDCQTRSVKITLIQTTQATKLHMSPITARPAMVRLMFLLMPPSVSKLPKSPSVFFVLVCELFSTVMLQSKYLPVNSIKIALKYC